MPDTKHLIAIIAAATLSSIAFAQQVPKHMHVDQSTVMSPKVATVGGPTQVPMTTYQAPNFLGQALEPIKAEIAEVRSRMAAIDGRENQRNGATIDALTALNSSSTSQRGALADIQATLDRIETRLKKLETAASQ
jgi:hypothetical protein